MKTQQFDQIVKDAQSKLTEQYANKFTTAFSLLGETWQGTSDTQRRALIHIVRDRIASGDRGKFLTSKTFEREVMPLFHGFGSDRVVACLNELLDIEKSVPQNQ